MVIGVLDSAPTATAATKNGGATGEAVKFATLSTLATYFAANDGPIDMALAANTTGITVTGYSITGSGALPLATSPGTLNTTGVVTVFSYALTDTGAGVGSLYFNYKVGAVSVLSLDLAGNLTQGTPGVAVGWSGPVSAGTNTAALGYTITAPLGTGNSTPATIIFKTPHVGSTGTTVQTATTVLTLGDALITIASGATLQMGAAYSAGVVTATGTIAIKDNTGTTYNMLVHS